jgi:hypothetical protein
MNISPGLKIGDDDFEPNCPRGKYWKLIKLAFGNEIKENI